MATESNPADMLTKALVRSKVEEFCAEIGQTSCEDGGQETQGGEAMETNAKIENEPNDAEVAKIENESKDAKLRWMHAMD